MKSIRNTCGILFGIAAVGAACLPVGALAQAYPSKAVRLVVPYPPGGAPDIVARLIGEDLGKAFGQAVVVENKPGQSGSIGADQVAKSTPDGYTLLVTTTATQSVNQHLYSKLPYDPLKEFSGVALAAYTPVLLATANTVPAKNLAELVSYAKANPGKLSYASAGPGTLQHIAAELMRGMTGTELLHVPYKGTGQINPDLLAGRVSMMFNSVAAFVGFVRDGKLRAIAVTRKSPALPDVPTFEEAGLKGFEVSPWYAVFAPAGTPRDVIARLNAETNRILASPAVAERFSKLGLERAAVRPEELDAIVRGDSEKWGKVIRDNKIRAD